MKPELLLPAGNIESFHAAIEGGADAIYFGLKKFSARNRAKNFSDKELSYLTTTAKQAGVKLYVTLNTLIKNRELSELLDILNLISKTGIDAVIIQDYGVMHLIREHFPEIEMHASTQMGIHNSIGINQAEKLGFTRTILSRELTINEIKQMAAKTNIEIEIFVHGALCYSFSGSCLFSSYLGGMSANRGLCKQPCRRIYTKDNNKIQPFNLRDLELIDFIPQFREIGIASLKIEGRMKPAEYIFKTASAYRLAIDHPDRINEAKEILAKDMGREKTSFFMGGSLKDAVSKSSFTGLFLGKIDKATDSGYWIQTREKLSLKDRIRIEQKDGHNTKIFKIKNLIFDKKETQEVERNSYVKIISDSTDCKKGNRIFLVSTQEYKFSDKYEAGELDFATTMRQSEKRTMLKIEPDSNENVTERLFLQIDSLKWMPKIFFPKINSLILDIPLSELEKFDPRKPFIKKNSYKLILKLPIFIPEAKIQRYQKVISNLTKNGIKKVMVSNLGQLELLNKEHIIFASEDIYTLNDMAIVTLQELNIKNFVYPLENDLTNYKKLKNQGGIVPLYFNPQLFYSRVPVESGEITDISKKFIIRKKNGMTITTPDKPVVIFQQKEKLKNLGYHNFLINLSFEKPSQNSFNRILKKFASSSPEPGATTFNFKNDLT